jgi:hypothetical protein
MGVRRHSYKRAQEKALRITVYLTGMTAKVFIFEVTCLKPFFRNSAARHRCPFPLSSVDEISVGTQNAGLPDQ